MLQAHLNAVERNLLNVSQIPANSGHSLHKGTPREAFIKEFLINHLSEQVAIGTGEIISAQSKADEPRNQIDIVLYKRNYPKLDFGGGINAFLAESVTATIEVKSTLDKEGLEQAIRTANTVKTLPRHVVTSFTSGYQPPAILNYVVAYDGPEKIKTVLDWIPEIHASLGIDPRPTGWPISDRLRIPSPSLDGVFILGKGFIYFDNSPVSFEVKDSAVANTLIRWGGANTPENNLFLFFMLLTTALSGISGSWLDAGPYMNNRQIFPEGTMAYLAVHNEPS